MSNKLAHTLLSGYRTTALIVMNTLVLLLVVSGILFAIFPAGGSQRQNPVAFRYGYETLGQVYPGLNEQEINALLEETWSRPYVYEPFTQFKERPFEGAYVNVDARGFRKTEGQGAWPPRPGRLTIFLFGGSTAFGYGVADDQTVASYLQAALTAELDRDVRVYNFGRGHYYSTQERILYERLLAAGTLPDVALFIDGLNDFRYHTDEPLFTNRFRRFVEQGGDPARDAGSLSNTALGRAARALRKRFTRRWRDDQPDERQADGTGAAPDTTRYADASVLDTVIHRYLQNKKLIEAASASYGVTPVFVWQPVPTYQYDQRYHLFAGGGFGDHSHTRYGYSRMAERLGETQPGDNFLWLADMQKHKTEPLYVDKVHYSSAFSSEIAAAIARLIVDRSLLGATDGVAQ